MIYVFVFLNYLSDLWITPRKLRVIGHRPCVFPRPFRFNMNIGMIWQQKFHYVDPLLYNCHVQGRISPVLAVFLTIDIRSMVEQDSYYCHRSNLIFISINIPD